MMDKSLVSIIIPVYNDTQRLVKCINALKEQTYPQELLDIVIVDNGSKENLNEYFKEYSNVRIVSESIKSQFAARNKGIAVSKGSVFAFTDADCIPSKQWIEEGVSTLMNNRSCGFVGGHVEFFYKKKKPNIIELYDSLLFLQQKRYVEQLKFAVTANMFTLKETLDKVGVFRNELKSGGDGDWGRRAYAAGFEPMFSQAAIVYHPARDSLIDLLRKTRRVTGGKFLKEGKKEMKWIAFLNVSSKETIFAFKRIFNLERESKYVRCKLFLIELLIQVVRLFELFRLKLGGVPVRA